MKAIRQSFFLFLCLLSLANCRRGGGGPMGDGPMGGGPMGQAGPCPKCNKRPQDEFARERLQPAPFGGNVGSGLNPLGGAPAFGGGFTTPENLLAPGGVPSGITAAPALGGGKSEFSESSSVTDDTTGLSDNTVLHRDITSETQDSQTH